MARVKKFDDGGLASLGGYAKSAVNAPAGNAQQSGIQGIFSDGAEGGGGSTASDGLNQINSGAQTVSNAIGRAQSDLGGGGGESANLGTTGGFKKGGSVKKRFDGKLNLSHCGVSTASKNKKQSNW